MPEILDGKFDITLHYPDVAVFHFSEARAFYGAVGIYYARKNKQARALNCYELLTHIAPDHPLTRRLGDEIIHREIANLGQKMFKNRQ